MAGECGEILLLSAYKYKVALILTLKLVTHLRIKLKISSIVPKKDFSNKTNNSVSWNNRDQIFYPPYSIIFHYSKQRKKDVNNETDED